MAISLIGRVFGRLTVQELAAIDGSYHRLWRCSCVCGGSVVTLGTSLTGGKTTSCGCLSVEKMRVLGQRRKHGATADRRQTREYKSWIGIITRCTNEKNPAYPSYGGRGITMCERWRSSFANFLEDMGPCPAGMSIDRIDNDGSYVPGNCRWADAQTQSNNRRNNPVYTAFGKSLTIPQWAREVGLKCSTLGMRLRHRKWPIEKALTEPLRYH